MVFVSSYHHIISPLGLNSKENYESVQAGKRGVQKLKFPFPGEEFCVAKISDDVCSKVIEQVHPSKLHTRLEYLSLYSIQQVLNQSGIKPHDPELGLIYTTTKGNVDLLAGASSIPTERAYLPVFAKHLQQNLGLYHTPMVLSNACISGLLGIIVAQRYIKQKKFKHVLVCGGDILSEFTISGFKSFNALSPEPSKPFDKDRVGINLGEAVATVLVTSDQNLSGKQKTILLSGASANDANHISGPSRTGDGLLQAIQHAMKNQTCEPDFISAHGTATPYNDEMESIAFERAGLTNHPVHSLKGYYGHTLGAAGVLETILSMMSLHDNRLIKSVGYDEKGVSGQIAMSTSAVSKEMNSFLKTASGFGGCNAAALFLKDRTFE